MEGVRCRGVRVNRVRIRWGGCKKGYKMQRGRGEQCVRIWWVGLKKSKVSAEGK